MVTSDRLIRRLCGTQIRVCALPAEMDVPEKPAAGPEGEPLPVNFGADRLAWPAECMPASASMHSVVWGTILGSCIDWMPLLDL